MKMQGNLFRDKKEGILMMTKDQYIESLRKLHLNLYSFGKKVENVVDNPIVRPSLNSFAATYELAEDPQYEDLMTATSNLTGQKGKPFTHLHQSTDDLIKKVKMQRLLGQKTAACFQRCVGMDAAMRFIRLRSRPMKHAAPSTTRILSSSGPMYRTTTGALTAR